MLWLLVLGLLVWATFLTIMMGDLRERTRGLERRLHELKDQLAAGPAHAPARKAPAAAPVEAVPQVLVWPVAATAATTTPRVAAPEPRTPPPSRPKPAGPPPREVARAWLEENGLAWAGGAALALGGLFLVTYAAQRGLFTPPFRIAAAAVVGFVLLGVSEWLKRRVGNPLAAALAAGAGAATLYGAVWASYWLYAFIGLPLAGGLLAVVSFGLLGLAFRHGEPLAMLAVLGGFLAPAVTGPQQWSAPALTGYLALMILTGFGVAAARRWGRAGVTALVGAFAWGVAGFAAEDNVRVAALALAPVVLAYAALEWRRRKGEPPIGDGAGRSAFTLLPAFALLAAVLLLTVAWMASAQGAWLHAAGTGAALVALLAALGDRRGLVPARLQAIGYLPALAFVALSVRSSGDPGQREAWGAALVVALAVAGVVAATGRRTLTSRLGAAGAGLVAVVLAVTLYGPVTTLYPWAPGAGTAVLLLAGAVVIARGSDDPIRDLPLAIWLWASGGSALIALQQGIDPRGLPAAAAALSLAGALLHARLGWRGFAAVMVASAVASLAALMSPVLFEALTDGRLPWWGLLLVAGASVGLTWLGSRIAERSGRPRESAEALSTASLVIAVAGAAVLLRHAASSAEMGGGRLDLFLEVSLRTVLILVAGLTSAQAVRADSSVIGRWRGQVLLCIGLAHGLVLQGLSLNPLGAGWAPAVAGPPLLDSLAVGFLAPGVILAFATWKKVSINRPLLAAYTIGAGVFLVLWAFMETRRLFQGASLQGGFDGIGRAEAAAYAVLALLIARAIVWMGERAAARPWTVSAFSREFVRCGRFAAWGALALAVLILGYGASPWWGPIDRPLAGVRATGLLFGLYVAGGAAAFMLAQTEGRDGETPLSRAARLVVVGIAFALLNLVVRLAFHGYDMRPTLQEQSLETWAFSAVWGLYGFGLLVYGAARRSNDLRSAGLVVLMITLAKIFLFDMSRLDGVIRAGSFLAVGALLLAAAVIVRRLGGTGGLPLGLGRKPSAEASDG